MAAQAPSALSVHLVTPRSLLHDGVAARVELPTAEGQVTVLPQHARYLAALDCGVVTLFGEGAPRRFFVADGFVEVGADRVVVLADRAQPVEDIDLARAEQDLAAAEARLGQLNGPDHPDYPAQRARRARALGRVAAAHLLRQD